VVNTLSETLSALDLASGQLTVQAALLGTWANRIAALPSEGGELLVAASGQNAVELLRPSDLAHRVTIDLGPGANPWFALPLSASRGLVSDWLSGDVRPLDLTNGRAGPRVPTTPGPEGMAVLGERAFVACTNYQGPEGTFGEGRVDVVDLRSWRVVDSFAVGRNPQDVLVDPLGRIHVLCTGTYGSGADPEEGSVYVLEPASGAILGVVPLGGSPGRFVRGEGSTIWVTGFRGGVRRYDAQSLAILPDPPDPTLAQGGFSALAWDAAEGTLYVTSFEADLLLAVDGASATVREAWVVGDGPVDVWVYRPENPR
jgi:DNA-binding beta-propeller fold protein YncE